MLCSDPSCSYEGIVDRMPGDGARCGRRQRVPRWSAERRPGFLARGPRATGPPPPSNPWVPEARRVRPADRKAGLREPIARLPGRLPALHSSPMERGGKQGDGLTRQPEKTSSRDGGALATGMIPKSVKRFSEKIMPQLENV